LPEIAVVGLANTGKSTVYSLLGGHGAVIAQHPHSTTEDAIGTAVFQPDPLLEELARAVDPAKVTPASAALRDVSALSKGKPPRSGLGPAMIARLRQADLALLVLRAFRSPEAEGPTDPVSQFQEAALELALADHESLEGQLGRLRKSAGRDPSAKRTIEAAEALLEPLSRGEPLFSWPHLAEWEAQAREFFLASAKPIVGVINLGEDQEAEREAILARLREAAGPLVRLAWVFGRLELEAREVEDADELLSSYGVAPGLHGLLQEVMAAGRWGRFYTAGKKEVRAWLFRLGATARECAGLIHTDFARGFIKAEVAEARAVLAAGGPAAAREKGLFRLEGKDYLVRDGDLMEVRFNV
jgi:ribosome-binding ATPase YchF (GTP1/OBG family)